MAERSAIAMECDTDGACWPMNDRQAVLPRRRQMQCLACGLRMPVDRVELLHSHLKLSEDCREDYAADCRTMFIYSYAVGDVVRILDGTISLVKTTGYMRWMVYGLSVGGASTLLRRFLSEQKAREYMEEIE